MSYRNTVDKHLQNGSVIYWSRRFDDRVIVRCGQCGNERSIRFNNATEKCFTGICSGCSQKVNRLHTEDETLSSGSVVYWSQRGVGRNTKVSVKCGICGNVKLVASSKIPNKHFTGYCAGCARTGYRSVHWRGGRAKHPTGYILVRLTPEHPLYCMADKHRLVSEHRLKMAQHIGRPLESHEVVHHKNGIKDDNRIENLELLTKRLHHTAFKPESYESELNVWNAIVKLVRSMIRK